MTKIDIKNLKVFINNLDGILNRNNLTTSDSDLTKNLIGVNKYPELKKISEFLNLLEIDKKRQYFSTKTGWFKVSKILSIIVLITGIILTVVGINPSKASMNPSSTLLIVGIVVLVVGFLALLVLSGVNRKRNLFLHGELMNSVKNFTENFIKEIIINNKYKDFNSIDDKCKELVMKVSYLYGVMHEYTMETNIYGTEYKKGPFNNIVGCDGYDGLDRRLQYLVSMLHDTTQSLRNSVKLSCDPNFCHKFFTQNYKGIAENYQENNKVYNESYQYNTIFNETTPIKFNKYTDQIEGDIKISDIPTNLLTLLRKIPGVGKIM